LSGDGLVKTERFKNPRYIGDPINAIRIFNEKEVDELVVLDIGATKSGSINFDLLGRITKEAFMPLAYGGGITTAEEIQKILGLGFEKVIINNSALNDQRLIANAAAVCGSQSIVGCIDVNKTLLGKRVVYRHVEKKNTNIDPVLWAKELETLGAGEILLYSVDRDGTYSGYDLDLIKAVASKITIPLVALGGARGFEDFKAGISSGASAVSAGSAFVFHGPRRAVLITYPARDKLRELDGLHG